MDVYEYEDGLIFEIEAPGMDDDDICLRYDGGYLYFSAERYKHFSKEDNMLVHTDGSPAVENSSRHYLYKGRGRSQHQESKVKIPWAVREEDIEATLEKGLLTVKVPLRKVSSPIPIKVT